MITYLENDDLDSLIKDKKVVLDFYADWCMPCQMLGEVFEEVIKEDNSINVIKINVDKFPDISRKYGVMSIPYLVLYNDNTIIKKSVGFLEKDELIYFINRRDGLYVKSVHNLCERYLAGSVFGDLG